MTKLEIRTVTDEIAGLIYGGLTWIWESDGYAVDVTYGHDMLLQALDKIRRVVDRHDVDCEEPD